MTLQNRRVQTFTLKEDAYIFFFFFPVIFFYYNYWCSYEALLGFFC